MQIQILHYLKIIKHYYDIIKQYVDIIKQCFEILTSGLFDRKFYLKNYGENLTLLEKMFPLYHYVSKGWKLKYNPSDKFDGKNFLEKYDWICVNPLYFFLKEGRYHYFYGFFKNIYQIKEENIQKYLEYKKTRNSKKVIYMCLTGDYDNIDDIKGHTYINEDWDYVLFTDSKKYLSQKYFGIWEVRPLEYAKLDNTRNNRWHKTHPHILFPNYEESIYLDSNINILTPYFFNQIKKKNNSLLLPKHCSNTCIYQEYQWAYREQIDDRMLIQKELNIIQKSGMPQNYGFWECNIIYRKHNLKDIIDIMNEWWYFIENYAKRDQLIFAYLMWKRNIKLEDNTVPNIRPMIKDYCIFLHQKPYEKP